MPANLTPEYMLAEARFKAAREPAERIPRDAVLEDRDVVELNT